MVKAKFFCPISNNLMIVFNTGECKLRTIFSKTPVSMKIFASFSSNFPRRDNIWQNIQLFASFYRFRISRFVLERVIIIMRKNNKQRQLFQKYFIFSAIFPKTGVQIILRPYISSRNSEDYSLPE